MHHALQKRCPPEKAKLWILYTNQIPFIMSPLDQFGGQETKLVGPRNLFTVRKLQTRNPIGVSIRPQRLWCRWITRTLTLQELRVHGLLNHMEGSRTSQSPEDLKTIVSKGRRGPSLSNRPVLPGPLPSYVWHDQCQTHWTSQASSLQSPFQPAKISIIKQSLRAAPVAIRAPMRSFCHFFLSWSSPHVVHGNLCSSINASCSSHPGEVAHCYTPSCLRSARTARTVEVQCFSCH